MKNRSNMYIFFFILMIVLTGCKGKKNDGLRSPTIIEDNFTGIEEDLNYYKIDIDLDEKEKTYTGQQETRYTNNTGVDLKEIYFRLYPNALKRFQSSIEIKDISVDGEKLDYKVEGQDDTLLKIDLKEPLLKNSKIQIDMEYFVKIPPSQERFGYGESTMRFGNPYPVLSVYDEDGWSTDPYYEIGDPFYTDISNYDVNISLDKDIIVATSGNILEETIKGKKKDI